MPCAFWVLPISVAWRLPCLPSCLQALVVMPARLRIPLPCPDLPELVLACIAAVQAHDSASHQVTAQLVLAPSQ